MSMWPRLDTRLVEMSSLNVINKIILVENLMCVFRNYSMSNLETKHFIKLIIAIVISIYFYSCKLTCEISQAVSEKTSNRMHSYCIILYYLIPTTNTLSAIALGLFTTKSFKIYVDSINAVHELCEGDILYQNSIKRFNKRAKIVAFKAATVAFAMTLSCLLEYFKYVNNFDVNSYAAFTIFDITLQYRYIVESLTYYVLIEVVVANLHYLGSAVSLATKTLRNEERPLGHEEFSQLSDDLAKWGVVSGYLSECGAQLSSCFGLQIEMMLFTATIYYILLLYKIVSYLMHSESSFSMTVHSVVTLSSEYLLVQLLILCAGQRTRNAADALDSALAALRNALTACSDGLAGGYARSAGALSRRLRAGPVRVRLLMRPLQMSLLMAVLAVTTNYTLILLQFNHVL